MSLIPIEYVFEDYKKAINVVLSCKDEKQFRVSMYYYRNLIRKWNISSTLVGFEIEKFLWDISGRIIRDKADKLGTTDFGPFNNVEPTL